MSKRLYVAYGSNLNIRQMKYRCPGAKLYGTGVIEDYALQFKGQPHGAFATIAPKEGACVPVAVWEISKQNEQALDCYEVKSFGLIPEIIGRLPVLTYLNPLDRDALRAILTEPKNSIIKQYVKLLEMDGIKLTFEDSVFEYIVDKAVEYKLGARGLRSIVETIMMDVMFEIPSGSKKEYEVTLDYAKQQLEKANMARLQTA